MPDADLPLTFRLFNEIGIVAQLSRTHFEARLPPGLTVPHFSVLNHLMRVRDGRTPLEIAQAFQVPKTTVTHWLAGLEERGFVSLRPNPGDGRSKQAWLTEAGRAFRDGAVAGLVPDLAQLDQVFAPNEIADLVAKLERLRVWLDANR